MADLYILYTVTGGRELFYAAVEPNTGRSWTAPTKDGAHRQAKDAGMKSFTERTISKPAFLRSLGIDDEPGLRIDRAARAADRAEPPPPAPSPAPWFVSGAEGGDAIPANFSMPRKLKGPKLSRRTKGKSPFAGGLIAPPKRRGNEAGDDLLIMPSESEKPAASPFSDAGEDDAD